MSKKEKETPELWWPGHLVDRPDFNPWGLDPAPEYEWVREILPGELDQ